MLPRHGCDQWVNYLAINSIWYKGLSCQGCHGLHCRPEVTNCGPQDVTDSHATCFIHDHRLCVLAQILQQRRRNGFQQLPPPDCHILFTARQKNNDLALQQKLFKCRCVNYTLTETYLWAFPSPFWSSWISSGRRCAGSLGLSR